jgi:hypothetical protein
MGSLCNDRLDAVHSFRSVPADFPRYGGEVDGFLPSQE